MCDVCVLCHVYLYICLTCGVMWVVRDYVGVYLRLYGTGNMDIHRGNPTHFD